MLTFNDVKNRIKELEDMEDGWYEGECKAPDKDGLKWLSECVDKYFKEEKYLPYMFPTFEGGISLEWDSEVYEISIDLDLITHNGSVFVYESMTQNDKMYDLDFNAEKSWKEIINEVKNSTHDKGANSYG